MARHYDMVVIGGGSGGIAVANRAARYGANCAVIEAGSIGGTCVNRGCVPKKIMWNAAEISHLLKMAPDYGFNVAGGELSWAALKAARDAHIRQQGNRYETGLRDNGVEVIFGFARFVAPGTIDVNGDQLSADHIVVATGATPVVPEVPGAELGITSDGFFELEKSPGCTAVVGAGYIAVEIAGLLNAFGCDVSLLLRKDHFLHGFDFMLRDLLMDEMVKDGVNIVPRRTVEKVARAPDGRMTLTFTDGEQLGGLETLVWAVGRLPNSRALNLEAVGVQTDAAGHVLTDAFQNTNVAGIYAIGDVTPAKALTPVAIAAGRRLADRLFGGMAGRHLDYSLVPTVVFSHPPVATVGLTESQALEIHGEQVKVYQRRIVPLRYALTRRQVRAAMKLVVVGEQEKVVGCHVIGEAADEILQGFAVAIGMGAIKADLDSTLALHPTNAEELVTMR